MYACFIINEMPPWPLAPITQVSFRGSFGRSKREPQQLRVEDSIRFVNTTTLMMGQPFHNQRPLGREKEREREIEIERERDPERASERAREPERERERQRERERERERGTESERAREPEREREGESERGRGREREGEREGEIERERETQSERARELESQRGRGRERGRERERGKEGPRASERESQRERERESVQASKQASMIASKHDSKQASNKASWQFRPKPADSTSKEWTTACTKWANVSGCRLSKSKIKQLQLGKSCKTRVKPTSHPPNGRGARVEALRCPLAVSSSKCQVFPGPLQAPRSRLPIWKASGPECFGLLCLKHGLRSGVVACDFGQLRAVLPDFGHLPEVNKAIGRSGPAIAFQCRFGSNLQLQAAEARDRLFRWCRAGASRCLNRTKFRQDALGQH